MKSDVTAFLCSVSAFYNKVRAVMYGPDPPRKENP